MFVVVLAPHVIAMKLMISTLFVQCLTIVFRWCLSNWGAIRGCSVGTASSPSVDLLSNHGCGSDSRHIMALFRGQFSVDGNLGRSHYCWSSLFWFIKGCKIMYGNLKKHLSMLVYIGTFFVSAAMIYLVQVKLFWIISTPTRRGVRVV